MIRHNGSRVPLTELWLVLLCALGCPSFGAAQAGAADAAQDPVKLSFVFMGCNRIQHSDWKTIKHDDPSSANLPQLRQSLKDISQLQPPSSSLFFVGDLVVNLADDDGKTLKKQLVPACVFAYLGDIEIADGAHPRGEVHAADVT